MAEARILPEEITSPEPIAPEAETKPQIKGDRLHIITSEVLGARCTELSQKLGLNEKTVIDGILSVGSLVVKVLAEGNRHAIVSIKDGKFHVAGFKD